MRIVTNLLAIETSTERLSLAVRHGGSLFTREIDAGQRHSELTLPLLHELLDEAGVSLQQLDAIAFGQGPGSFTGVRIACGLSQGLALGLGKPVLPVPTQMALAEQQAGARVLVAIDARMGEIYFAAYRRDDIAATGWIAEVAPVLLKPTALPHLEDHDWAGIGSAFDVAALGGALAQHYGRQLNGVVLNALPRAADVAAIATRQIARAGIACAIKPEDAAPLYLRNKVAMTIEERKTHHANKVAA